MRQKTLIKRIKSWTKRSAIVSLAFLFVLSNILPAFTISAYAQAETSTSTVESQATTENTAQEGAFFDPGSSSISPTEETNVIDLAAPGTTEKTNINNSDKPKDKTKDPKQKDGGGTEVDLQAQALAGTAISNSQANNFASAKSKVNLPVSDTVSGALNYEYPLVMPSGRNGLRPDLKLIYNSQAGEDGSVFGYGWSLNIPYIERINKTGSEKLYSENYFNSSLSGELVNVEGSIYGSKVDNGEFLKYEFANNTWTVTDKAGTRYKFGYSTATRQDNPNDATKIFKWMLEEARDLNDNYVRYEYYKDSGQIYPSGIFYTGNGTTDGIFTVEFTRETRNDMQISGFAGFSVATNQRIKEITTKVNSIWVRKYTLAYTTGDNDRRSLLGSVIESGQDELGGVIILPPTTFNYQVSGTSWVKDNGRTLPVIYTMNYSNGTAEYVPMFSDLRTATDYYGVQIADVNGDGLADLVQSGYKTGESGTPVSTVYINKGATDWEEDVSWAFPQDVVNGQTQYIRFVNINPSTGDRISDMGVRLADVNGDGLVDLVRSRSDEHGVYINNGSGWVKNTSWYFPTYIDSNGYTKTVEFVDSVGNDLGARIADVNGDGIADIIRSAVNYSSNCGCDIPDYAVYINNGTGWVKDFFLEISSDL